MAVFTLGDRPPREELGIGSFLNTIHEGPIKRPTEENHSIENIKKAKEEISPDSKEHLKTSAIKTYLEMCKTLTRNPDEHKTQSRKLRKELGRYFTPEETNSITANVALILALEDSDEFHAYLNETGQIKVTNPIGEDQALVECREGSEISIKRHTNGQKIVLGEENYDITTGEPYLGLEERLEQALQSH